MCIRDRSNDTTNETTGDSNQGKRKISLFNIPIRILMKCKNISVSTLLGNEVHCQGGRMMMKLECNFI